MARHRPRPGKSQKVRRSREEIAAEKLARQRVADARQVEDNRARESLARHARRIEAKAGPVMRRWSEERRAERDAERRAKRGGRDRAGKDGAAELGSKRITNPYDGTAENAVINLRHDVLEHLSSRGKITDAEKFAGDKFKSLTESAGIGGARAIDYERARVDGGKLAEPLTDRVIDATTQLNSICAHLGRIDYSLLVDVLVYGHAFKQIAALRAGVAEGTKRAELHIGRRFKDALNELASYFGEAQGMKGSIRSWR